MSQHLAEAELVEAHLKVAHEALKESERRFEEARAAFETHWPKGDHRWWQPSERTEFDEEAALEVLPGECFDLKLNKKKLDALVTLGKVTEEKVASCSRKRQHWALVIR